MVIAVAADSGAPLDAAVANKEQQISALKSDVAEAECDYAVDEPIIEGCEQLDSPAQALAAEIDTLKTQADQPAAKAPAPRAARPYSYAAHTKPNISYRTFCVRECDGFSSTPASFLSDEPRCQSSCSSAAKLFYSPVGSDNPGEWFY
jgi:hypothetical protein